MSVAINVKNLSRHFEVYDKKPGLKSSLKSIWNRPKRIVKAVDNINFQIKPGELVGFIGPNGAGKTTTLKCLSGLLYPTKGEVEVLGFTPWHRKREFLKQIGFIMGQKGQLWWDIPPQETFLLNQAIYEIPDKEYQKRLRFFRSALNVKKEISIQTRKLSLGQRMKCELVAALIHQPKVIFLDEPTIGLDVIMQDKVRDFIRNYNREFGATIILTSHYMKDVQALCRRLIVIDKGKIHFDGLLSKLKNGPSSQKILTLTFKDDIPRKDLKGLGKIIKYEDLRVTLSVSRKKASQVASQALEKFPVTDLNIEDIPIEETIKKLFQGQ